MIALTQFLNCMDLSKIYSLIDIKLFKSQKLSDYIFNILYEFKLTTTDPLKLCKKFIKPFN